jgi:hypothetical protein
MSYYPPSIRPNGFIETKKKKKNKKMNMIGWVLVVWVIMFIIRKLRE